MDPKNQLNVNVKPKRSIHGILKLIARQNWIRFGIRDRILRIFCNPDRVKSYEFEIPFFGLKYRGNLACYLDWVVYFYGAYEEQELYLLRDLVKNIEDPLFIDVGANVGQHSIYMSKYCREVHSFEPYEPVRRLLDEKIQYNFINNIIVHNVALGEKNEYLEFFAPKGANTGTGSFISTHAMDNNESIGKLKVVNGDEYIIKLGLKKNRFD